MHKYVTYDRQYHFILSHLHIVTKSVVMFLFVGNSDLGNKDTE